MKLYSGWMTRRTDSTLTAEVILESISFDEDAPPLLVLELTRLDEKAEEVMILLIEMIGILLSGGLENECTLERMN